MPWTVLRLLGILMAASIVWSLFTQYAGILFLLCAAVAGWRLWLAAPGLPRQRPGAGRLPGQPPRRQSRGDDAPAPAATRPTMRFSGKRAERAASLPFRSSNYEVSG